MLRLTLIFLSCLSLSGCRYWVLYEFAEQFCELETYVEIAWQGRTENRQESLVKNTKQVSINFHEPVLNRPILLRYLNAQPYETLSQTAEHEHQSSISEDKFAIRTLPFAEHTATQLFEFSLAYHALDEHALLESALLDSRLSRLFSPALIEPILRSICSDDYDISFKRLDMRFTLADLPKESLPTKQQVLAVFGATTQSLQASAEETSLRYEFDFLARDESENWSAQNKPISMLFKFDVQSRLTKLYIHYHKYSYWLDVETLSGRLLVIRSE